MASIHVGLGPRTVRARHARHEPASVRPRASKNSDAVRVLAVLSLLMIPVLPAAASGSAVVQIAEIHADPATGDREFVELHNAGSAAVNLAGWQIRDAANNTFTFSAWTLYPGDRVVVWGGGSDDGFGPAWSKATVWNNGGDTVQLLSPSGNVTDTLVYGPGGEPAPAKGKSLQRDGGWVEGDPTPGAAPDATGGAATATVLDVAPTVAMSFVPSDARTNATVKIHVHVSEPNGDAVTWTLRSGPGLLAAGNTTHDGNVSLTTPLTARTWTLVLAASDAAGNSASDVASIEVRGTDLVVTFPDGPLQLPGLAPGGENVQSSVGFRLENVASATKTPRIDLSPFRNGTTEIAVDGNVRLGTRTWGSDAAWTWTDYSGPLTSLPALNAGGAFEVVLEIKAVPEPLAAGQYATSFTVVP